MRASIIVVTRNRRAELARALCSCVIQEGSPEIMRVALRGKLVPLRAAGALPALCVGQAGCASRFFRAATSGQGFVVDHENARPLRVMSISPHPACRVGEFHYPASMNQVLGYRYIRSTPGVRGGHPHLEETRIAVHDVVAYHLLGCSVAEITDRFEGLSRSRIYECLAYYEDHREEIERLALAQTSPTLES